jgi:hypothetical protein
MNEKKPSDFEPPKLRAVNGCGTTLLGASNRMDGSFVTTRWITLLGVPLIPLESYRVRRLAEKISLTEQKVFFDFISIEPLDKRQIRNSYAYVVAMPAVAIIFGLFGSMLGFIIAIGMWGLLIMEIIFKAK